MEEWQSEWHRDRSFATRRCWGTHVQELGHFYHVCVRWYIVGRCSLGLSCILLLNKMLRGGVLPSPGSSDSALRDPSFRKYRSTTIAPHCLILETLLPHALRLSATSSSTQVYTALAPSGIAIARSSGICIATACSKRHHDRSLRVASQSLAVLDFRRPHGSHHESARFTSLKLQLGMGVDFSAKQQSNTKNLWAQTIAFSPSTRKWEKWLL